MVPSKQSLEYVFWNGTSTYTGNVMTASVAITFTVLVAVVASVALAYYSNKYCTKKKMLNSNSDYLKAGELPVDKRKWSEIQMTMLKTGITEPPKNAPPEF